MPAWLGVAIGIMVGIGVIAGAVCLAFRPYLAIKPPKAWMPEPTGMATGDEVTGASGGPYDGGGLGP